MPDHDPQVIPFADVVDRWIVRCPCGPDVEYATKAEAEQARDEHMEDR